MAGEITMDAWKDDYCHVDESLLYTSSNVPGPGVCMDEWESVLESCACTGDCYVRECRCIGRFGAACYVEKKLVDALLSGEWEQPVIECHAGCNCGPNCPSRLIQNGPLKGLEVFGINSLGKGYGLKTVSAVCRGQFVCEYAGEVIGLYEAKRRFALQQSNTGIRRTNYIFVLREFVGREKVLTTVIDPTCIGNIGRYINHSCDPNLVVIPVRVDSLVPHLALFAKRDILPGEELSFSYGSGLPASGQIGDHLSLQNCDGVELTPCLCNSGNCMGMLPFDSSLM